MPTDHQEPPVEIERPSDKHRKPVVRAAPVRGGLAALHLAGLADPRGFSSPRSLSCRAPQERVADAVMRLSS
jgi:hypothetical protein